VNKLTPTQVIILLNDEGFDFTMDHFDKFIKGIVHQKSRGYLICMSPYYDKGIVRDTREKMINIMFTKFNPTRQQLKLLLVCMKSYPGQNGCFYWVDVLLDRGYTFNNDIIDKLLICGYTSAKILNKADINIEKLELIASKVASSDYIKFKKIILKHKIKPTTTCLINCVNNFHWEKWGTSYGNNMKFVKMLLDNGVDVDENCLYRVLKKTSDFDIFKEIINNITMSFDNFSVEFVDFMCSKNLLQHITYLIDNGLTPTIDILNTCIQCSNSKTQNHSFYNFIINYGIIPNIDTLIQAYKDLNLEMVNDIITKFKVYPNISCLNIVLRCHSHATDYISHVLDYKVMPDKSSFDAIKNTHNMNKNLEILINFGLKVTYKMVDETLIIRKPLDNLIRFDIPYDEKLYYMCYKNKFFPSTYMNKFTIDKNVLKLRDVFFTCINGLTVDTKTLINMLEFILDNNIKPDRYCIDALVRYKNSIVWDFFIDDLNLQPTFASIYNLIVKNENNIKIVDMITNNINFDYKIMCKPYDDIDLTKIEDKLMQLKNKDKKIYI
jgi:hypothetical protein